MEVMRVIREFFMKLQADLNIRIDANSLSYIRLMNHIKFLLLRLNNDEELQMDITAPPVPLPAVQGWWASCPAVC